MTGWMFISELSFSMNLSRERGRIFSGGSGANRDSPLFGKDHMRTFERCLIADPEVHTEVKNLYSLLDNETVVNRILAELGSPTGILILSMGMFR